MVSPVLYLTECYRMDLHGPSHTWSFYMPTRLGLGYVLHREECEPGQAGSLAQAVMEG